MAEIQEQLSDHVVVLGFGLLCSEGVQELIEGGTDPRRIVILDPHPERLARAKELGCNVLLGDATRNEHLLAAQINMACALLISAGRDDTSILIVLTARHLAPDVPITVVIRAADNELLARQAGADNVINPVRFCGLLLAGSAEGSHTSDYLTDLASFDGDVQLIERAVLPEEVGRSIHELASAGMGLRVYRDGKAWGFRDGPARSLQPGDIIIEVRPTELSPAG